MALVNYKHNEACNALGKFGKLAEMQKIFTSTVKSKLPITREILNPFIAVYAKTGNVPEMEKYFNFNKSRGRKFSSNIDTYNALIEGYGR